MQDFSQNKPLKYGRDPHREFQCLETIYVSEDVSEKIKVGDRVTWDFENKQLKVNDENIWNIPLDKGRYYGCIDSHRHKVKSWIVAKEGNKIKLFTSTELKNPYGQTIRPTESESIEENASRILPIITRAIGKGFWQFFDEQSKPSQKSLLKLLARVSEIKELADEIFIIDSFAERELKINQIIDKIRRVNEEELPKVKEENPYPQFNIDNMENYWRDKLPNNVWASLEDKVKTYITTGELIYRFLDHLSIPNIDWTAANVEFCKAIELELNRKIIYQFGQWLKKNEHCNLLFQRFNWNRDGKEWHSFVRKAGDIELTLGTINWFFQKLKIFNSTNFALTPFQRELLSLFEEYTETLHLTGENRNFLYNLSDELKKLIITRNGSLHTEFLEKEKVDDFISRVVKILPKVITT